MTRQRNTVQKEQVYTAITELTCHPTADDVYDRVRQKFPRISRATVYRVLNQMADSGVILRIRTPISACRYDCRTEPHHHAQCLCCGRIFDIDFCPAYEINCSEVQADGLTILGHSLIFEAICDECSDRNGGILPWEK